VRDLATSGSYQKLCPEYAVEQTRRQQKEKNEAGQNKHSRLQEVVIEPYRDMVMEENAAEVANDNELESFRAR
jgi:hypothetical protein